VVLILSRQPMPTLDRAKYAPASGVAKGGYILSDAPGGKPDVLLIATGSRAGALLRDLSFDECLNVRIGSPRRPHCIRRCFDLVLCWCV